MSEKNKEIIKKEWEERMKDWAPEKRKWWDEKMGEIAKFIEQEIGLWKCNYCGKMIPVKDNVETCPGCGKRKEETK